MNRFAALLDRLACEPRRTAKIALIADYFRFAPDPDRGVALAVLVGDLSFRRIRPGIVRALIEQRTDPVLLAISRDYVGNLPETAALMWPEPAGLRRPGKHLTGESLSGEHLSGEVPDDTVADISVSEVVGTLENVGASELPGLLADTLDRLDGTGRWALLKFVNKGLPVGVSAHLAKSAVAALGNLEPGDIEEIWHGLEQPYEALFAWAEGRAGRPDVRDPTPFRPLMQAHALKESDLDKLDPSDFVAEWKWDGIRVQAVSARDEGGNIVQRLYSRTGDDISDRFPDLLGALDFDGALDGELLIVRDGRVQSFNTLQQRLDRKAVTAKTQAEFPAHLIVHDLLAEGGEDLRDLPLSERRARLEVFAGGLETERISISPLVEFTTWDELAVARSNQAGPGASPHADGVMIKRLVSPYLAGAPNDDWIEGHRYAWKRDPYTLDAVMMYAQRGRGAHGSAYSDYTFGVWRGEGDSAELVPIGKADMASAEQDVRGLEQFISQHTVNRFGPVREVDHLPDKGLVLEVLFEGMTRSARRKSGLTLRFPRIGRIHWDKLPGDADNIEVLEELLNRE